MNECILALDLGIKTGWAVRDAQGTVFSGTCKQSGRKADDIRLRWPTFLAMLDGLHSRHGIQVIYYEKVMNHAATQAGHVYGAFEGLMECWAVNRNIETRGIGVGVIKKFWTGKGNAKKDVMESEAKRRGFVVKDDNEADALAILHFGITEHD